MSKQVLKDVTEAAPTFAKLEIAHIEIRKVRPVEPATCTRPRLEGAMAKLIVFLPEFGIAEDLIGLRDLLKTALSFLIPWVQVGMMLTRLSAIGLFDFLFRGRALDPKYFIIIALCR
jgi:hypothetical protein